MAKKADFLNESSNSANVMRTVTTNNTDSTNSTPHTKQRYYRLNLNLPLEFKDYLAKAAYDASSPGHIVSITQYINNLIRRDMEEHGKK